MQRCWRGSCTISRAPTACSCCLAARADSMLLVDALSAALQAAAYAVLSLTVRLAVAWRELASLAAGAAGRLAAAAPALRPALAALAALPAAEHIGSQPRPPTVLGVAVAEEVAHADWPAAVEALGRLLAWAHARGFRTVLLYEPAGCLQQPHWKRQLELQLLLHRLNGAVLLQAGWQQAQQQAQQQQSLPGSEGSMTAVLLAAADGQWPLMAAAGAGAAGEGPPPSQQEGQPTKSGAAAEGEDEEERAAALDAAIAAPAHLRRRLQAAAGALAGAEPDFVLVTGPALTLAGFPAWLVRTSEIYPVGPLATLTADRLQAALRRFGATKQRFGK